MDGLQVRNSLVSGVGSPYQRPMGIPQGCPLSMVWLSMVMQPMFSIVRAAGGEPRTLADDATVSATGPNHWLQLTRSGALAMQYLQQAGARISRSKSIVFSTSEAARSRMR
eukprot:4158224-Alexandrium_andersonii.AAC.1